MTLYEHLVSPLLRVLDPEQSHTLTMRLLGAAQGVPGVVPVVHRLSEAEDPRMAVSWKGLRFPNPIGLAAGADKDASAHALLAALGFGFIEVGTVTPEPQRGNPKPRMFRLRDRKAMINSLGFPSKGADHVRQRLERRQVDIPVGINLGKNAGTPLESTALDYGQPLEMLHHHGDYFVLNVSSPNTPGLRDLQASPALADLAAVLAEKRHSLAAAAGGPVKPLLVKVSPDLQIARVFYTSLGDAKARDETARALERATPFFRRQIGSRLRLRRVPQIEFRFDETIQHQDRIEQILRDLREEEANRPSPADVDPDPTDAPHDDDKD